MRTRSRATTTPGLGPVLDFMRLLWAVEHGLQKTSKRMARQIGLTGPQRLALRLVGRFPDIAPGELAVLLRLHPSTITGVLLRLERQALIARRPDARDGRLTHLRLTAKGRRANRSTAGTVEEVVKVAIRHLGRRRLVAAQAALTILAEHLRIDKVGTKQ